MNSVLNIWISGDLELTLIRYHKNRAVFVILPDKHFERKYKAIFTDVKKSIYSEMKNFQL